MRSDAEISNILSGWEAHLLNQHLDDAGTCPECSEESRECECPVAYEIDPCDDDREPYYGD